MIDQLSSAARRLDRTLTNVPGWLWPASMVVLALAVWTAALVFQPEGEITTFLGRRLGETCAFLTTTGSPCPNCGMTRSFLWSARLSVLRGLLYNPAGALLFWWITVGGLIGAVRLVTRDPRRLAPHWQWFVAWSAFWTALYLASWAFRLAGVNPLP